jgi:hypothetical protein
MDGPYGVLAYGALSLPPGDAREADVGGPSQSCVSSPALASDTEEGVHELAWLDGCELPLPYALSCLRRCSSAASSRSGNGSQLMGFVDKRKTSGAVKVTVQMTT